MSGRVLIVGAASAGTLLIAAVLILQLARGVPSPEEEPARLQTEEVPATDETEAAGETPAPAPRPLVPFELASVFDESKDTIARMKAVDALGRDLSPEALSALRWLLKKPDADEALRNNVANRLRKCGEEHLVADLTEMAWDESETPKWRNYCVQHLYTCYEQGEEPDPTILDTLFRAAVPTETSEKLVRICAVWSLACIATPRDKRKMPDEGTLARIHAAALDALREKDAYSLITTAGVQSSARLGLTEALPDIRRIAGNDNTKPTHLRVVAVAALGDLGDETDLPLLERLSSSAKGQLKGAAELALKRLDQAHDDF